MGDSNSVSSNNKSIETTYINYFQLVAKGGRTTSEMESLGWEGQEGQASQVNNGRVYGLKMQNSLVNGQSALEMPNDKSTLTPNNRLVLVCGILFYKKTENYRYM